MEAVHACKSCTQASELLDQGPPVQWGHIPAWAEGLGAPADCPGVAGTIPLTP